MNNIFSFNRFKNLLLKDGKMYFRNFGLSIIVFCCLNIILWIFNLLFSDDSAMDQSMDQSIRFGYLLTWTAIAMMTVSSKVYYKVNLSREGESFAMLPVSVFEKFVSMFVYCAIVTPILVFFGGYLVDTLLSLFPFGGFEEPINLRLYTPLGYVSAPDADSTFFFRMMVACSYIGFTLWTSIFMLGNMLFKKHKVGKTFACCLGIIFLFFWITFKVISNSKKIVHLLQAMSPRLGSWVIMSFVIVATVVVLYFTYRKIKTQKY